MKFYQEPISSPLRCRIRVSCTTPTCNPISAKTERSYAFLRDAAHNFATGQTRIDLWRFCSPPLVSAIRGRHTAEIDAMRNAFEADVRALGATLTCSDPALA